MSGYYRQGFMFQNAAAPDPAVARLRTDQMLRALRVTAEFRGGPSPRVVGLSGQILDADDMSGDWARIVEGLDDEPRGY